MPVSTSGTKSPFCINTNQLFHFYHSAAPTTHICVYFSAATPATASTTAVQLLSINIINSTNHLQHAKLRILLQHLTSHVASERSGGPPKRPAAKRPCIYMKSIVTADSSARKCEVPPISSASDRDPLASDPGPSTFVSRALSPRVSFSGLRRAYPRARALGVVRRCRARRRRTGRILRKCLGSTRCWRRSLWCCCCPAETSRSYSLLEKYLWCLKHLWCLLLLNRVSPSACWTPTALDPHDLAFFGP